MPTPREYKSLLLASSATAKISSAPLVSQAKTSLAQAAVMLTCEGHDIRVARTSPRSSDYWLGSARILSYSEQAGVAHTTALRVFLGILATAPAGYAGCVDLQTWNSNNCSPLARRAVAEGLVECSVVHTGLRSYTNRYCLTPKGRTLWESLGSQTPASRRAAIIPKQPRLAEWSELPHIGPVEPNVEQCALPLAEPKPVVRAAEPEEVTEDFDFPSEIEAQLQADICLLVSGYNTILQTIGENQPKLKTYIIGLLGRIQSVSVTA